MATVRATINTALRMVGRLGAGREPRAADQKDVLDALRGMYGAWIVGGAFGRLRDVIPQMDYTAQPNERIFRNSASVLQITLPETVAGYQWRWDVSAQTLSYEAIQDGDGFALLDDDGGVIDSTPDTYRRIDNPTTPRDGSVVAVVDAFADQSVTFLYDATMKRWQQIDALGLDDVAPRSSADPLGLAACLAIEIADQFGVDVSAATVRQAQRFSVAATHRYSMPREQQVGQYV